MELITEVENISQKKVNYIITEPRYGDVGVSIANVDKIHKKLEWKAKRALTESVRSSWNFVTNNG